MNQVIGRNPLDSLGTPTFGLTVVKQAASGRRGRGAASTKLNLVSLMDIFTILVFFLMLNSGDVEVLQPDERINLPGSTATLKPSNAPVIKVTEDAVIFRDQIIAETQNLQAGESIPSLEAALKSYATEVKMGTAGVSQKLDENGKANSEISGAVSKADAVSIMSDASVNYALLKRVLFASAQSGYRNIGLATEYSQASNSEAAMGTTSSN